MRGIRTIVKALWIGATMTVPGVSGGTMAVITGIYEPLIHAVNGVRKDPKNILDSCFSLCWRQELDFSFLQEA